MTPSPPTLPRRAFAFARRVALGLYEHHAFDHAATMSFYFFLGMIPLVLVAGMLAGNLVQRQGAEELVGPLYRALPGVAADLLRAQIQAVGEIPLGSVAPLSALGFVWLTTNGVHNLMDVFELLIHARPRPWWQQRLLAMIWIAGLLVVTFVAAWLLLIVNGLTGSVDGDTNVPRLVRQATSFFAAGWHRAGVFAVFATISTVGLAVFYRLATKLPKGVKRHIWPGTFVAHVLWVAVSWAFGTYVRTMAHYAIFYGSLATVAVILLWLYLTSLALVVGAEVNAQLGGLRDPHADGPLSLR